MNLEIGAPRRVIYGRSELARVGELASEYGRRAVIITGRASGADGGGLQEIEDSLKKAGVASSVLLNMGEPAVARVDTLTHQTSESNPDVIIGLGGGSAIDAGKAVAAMLANDPKGKFSVIDFLEGVGAGQKIKTPSLPFMAIPTTSGTGAEATRNAVIRSDDSTFKKSLRSHFMRPEIALVDPALSHTMPLAVTASTGADAMTQLIEAMTSSRSSIITEGIAREGLTLVAWALERAYIDPSDAQARDAMSLAGLLSGLALDNAGLGAVHGLASPLGGYFQIPHGVVCANLLPEITEVNIRTARQIAREDEDAHKALIAYRRIARLFNGGFDCEAEELVEFLHAQRNSLRIPHLRAFGVKETDIPRIVARCRGGSMKTNPVELDDEALTEVLTKLVRLN